MSLKLKKGEDGQMGKEALEKYKEDKEREIMNRMTRAFNLAYGAYRNSIVYKEDVWASKMVGPNTSKIYDELKKLDERLTNGSGGPSTY